MISVLAASPGPLYTSVNRRWLCRHDTSSLEESVGLDLSRKRFSGEAGAKVFHPMEYLKIN